MTAAFQAAGKAGLIARFKKGRDAAYAERGFTPPGRKVEQSSSTGEAGDQPAEPAPADTRQLLTEVTELAEQLQNRITELEAERDDAQKLLGEVTTSGDDLRKRCGELETERDNAKKLLGELTSSAEQLQKSAAGLEAERDLLAEALQLPGVRKVLLKLFHTDSHPNADEEQHRVLTAGYLKLNSAYELIGRLKNTA